MPAEVPAYLNAPELATALSDPAFAVGVIGVGMFAAEGPRAAIALYKDETGKLSRPIMSFENHAVPLHDGAEHRLMYPSPNTGLRNDVVLVAHAHPDGPATDQLPGRGDLGEFLWQNEQHPGITKGIIMAHAAAGIVTLTLFRAREDRNFHVDSNPLYKLRNNANTDDIINAMGDAGIIAMSVSAEVSDSALFDAANMSRVFYR